MSSCDEWMPLYVGRYLGDTGHLTYDQHGPYLLLLMHYWRKGPLPDDDTMLAAIARVPLDVWMTRMGRILRDFFEVQEDGLLHQKRADMERAKRAGVSADRAAAGRAGARKRWQQDDNVVTARAVVTGEAQEPSPPPDGKPIANAIASAIDLPKQTDSMIQVQVPKEERVHKASLYGAEAPASKAVQASLLPEDDPPEPEPDPEKEPTHPVWSEGLEIMAWICKKPLSTHRSMAAGHIKRALKSASGDGALVLDVLRHVENLPIHRQKLGTFLNILEERVPKTPEKMGPRLVHNAPPDPQGIQAWCKNLPGVQPSGSETEKARGNWLAYGYIVDSVANCVADAAELPKDWRGDWSPLQKWLEDGYEPDAIVDAITLAIEKTRSQGKTYTPGAKSLGLFFNNWVRAARKVA